MSMPEVCNLTKARKGYALLAWGVGHCPVQAMLNMCAKTVLQAHYAATHGTAVWSMYTASSHYASVCKLYCGQEAAWVAWIL